MNKGISPTSAGRGVTLSRNLLCGNAIESFDRVAQLVEQRTFNPQVVGSSPTPVTLHLRESE